MSFQEVSNALIRKQHGELVKLRGQAFLRLGEMSKADTHALRARDYGVRDLGEREEILVHLTIQPSLNN